MPTVGTTFSQAFASTWRVILSMPLLFVSAGAGVVAVAFAAKFFGANPIQAGKLTTGGLTASEGLAILAGNFLTYFAQSVFLPPVAVAMHRFIIRSETTKGIVSIARMRLVQTGADEIYVGRCVAWPRRRPRRRRAAQPAT